MHVAIYNIVWGTKLRTNILLWVERSARIASTWNSMKKNEFLVQSKISSSPKRKEKYKKWEKKTAECLYFFLLKITGSFFIFFDRIRFDSIDFVRVSSGVHYERDMQNAWLLSGCAFTWICLNSTHACMEDCVKSTQLQLCKTLSVCACAHGSLTLSLPLLFLFFIVVYFWILYFLARTHLSSWNMLTLARDNFHQRVTYNIFVFICRLRTLLSIPHMHQISSNIYKMKFNRFTIESHCWAHLDRLHRKQRKNIVNFFVTFHCARFTLLLIVRNP